MNRRWRCAAIAAIACVLSACDESAAPPPRDTAAAEQAATTEAARVQQKADARIAAAIEGQKITDEQAASDYEAALARCEGLSGATQQTCRDQADADYHIARTRAEQERARSDPKQP